MRERFWDSIALQDLSREEWEALCDGCARCCLNKLQDDATGELFYTSLACKELDIENARCGHYSDRLQATPNCINVRELLESDPMLTIMPASCAYRLRAQGLAIPEWHPLRSGDFGAVKAAGVSVAGRVLSEEFVHEDEWQQHIIKWVEL